MAKSRYRKIKKISICNFKLNYRRFVKNIDMEDRIDYRNSLEEFLKTVYKLNIDYKHITHRIKEGNELIEYARSNYWKIKPYY